MDPYSGSKAEADHGSVYIEMNLELKSNFTQTNLDFNQDTIIMRSK